MLSKSIISSHGAIRRHYFASRAFSLTFADFHGTDLLSGTFRAILTPYSECGKEANRARYDRRRKGRLLHTGTGSRKASVGTGQCNEEVETWGDTWTQVREVLADQQRRIRTVRSNSEACLLQPRGKLTLPIAESRLRSDDWTPADCNLASYCYLSLIIHAVAQRCQALHSVRNKRYGSVYPKGSAMMPTDTIYTYSHTRDRVKRVFVCCNRPLCRVCGVPSSKLAWGYGISLCAGHFTEIEEAMVQGMIGRLDEQYEGVQG